ncbi:MAG: glycosyl transferase [Bacteroidaceae bacterium]|nr:glycosyl transferase [Bacteroidaceae bacterium]
MIPKIIHYCWLSDNTIPQKLRKYMETWKKMLPDYQFMLWDSKCFDIASVSWVEQAFNAKMYAFAADYIRLYAVYHYGGIYLDMDVEVLRNFDDLLNRPYILGQETFVGIEGGVFGAEKHSPIIAACMEHYVNRSFCLENDEMDKTPLPIVLMNTLNERFGTEVTETPDFSKKTIQLLPCEYLTAKYSDTGIVKTTNNTYSIHHFAGSWMKQDITSYWKHKMKVFFAHVLGDNCVRKISKKLFHNV